MLKIRQATSFPRPVGAGGNAKFGTLQEGVAGGVQLVVYPYAELGVNYGYAHTDNRNEQGQITGKGTFHTYSVGGFANLRVVEDVLVGAGVDYTLLEDTNTNPDLHRNDRYQHWQPYAAFQVLLFKQLFVKAVVAYAVANLGSRFRRCRRPSRTRCSAAGSRLLYLF